MENIKDPLPDSPLVPILTRKDFSYLSVLTLGEAFEKAIADPQLAKLYYEYISDGFAKKEHNVLEKFNATVVAPNKRVAFHDAVAVFRKRGYSKYTGPLERQQRLLAEEARQDYLEGYHQYFGTKGHIQNRPAAIVRFCNAICKWEGANYCKVLLGQSFFSSKKGTVFLPMIGDLFLQKINLSKLSASSKKEVKDGIYRILRQCGEDDLTELFAPGSNFYRTGKYTDGREDQDDYFTAHRYHNSPTPMFFYHLGNNVAKKQKNYTDFVDACNFYELANRIDPRIALPAGYSKAEREAGIIRRNQEIDADLRFLRDLEIQLTTPSRPAVRYSAVDPEEQEQLINFLSEVHAQEEASRIQREIEEMMYGRGSLGHGYYSY